MILKTDYFKSIGSDRFEKIKGDIKRLEDCLHLEELSHLSTVFKKVLIVFIERKILRIG